MSDLAIQSMTPDSEGMPGTLAPEERRRISVRLGAGLIGLGLLGLGTLLVRVEPDQWQIGELCRGLAAAVVGIPTLVSGLRGIVTGDTRRATDQLVAIAVLAAAATRRLRDRHSDPAFPRTGAPLRRAKFSGRAGRHRRDPRARRRARP